MNGTCINWVENQIESNQLQVTIHYHKLYIRMKGLFLENELSL